VRIAGTAGKDTCKMLSLGTLAGVVRKRGIMRKTLSALFVAITMTLLIPLGFSPIRAQSNAAAGRPAAPAGSSLTEKFVGTWKLVNIEQRNAKGEVVPPATPNATRTGYIIYDQAGYVAVSIMPAGRKRNAGVRITDEEAKAAIEGYAAYFGTFSVDGREQAVTHHLQGSLTPGMAADQKRFFEFSGNRLTLKPPPAANGNQARLTWERVPDLPALTADQQHFVGFWKLVSNERRDDKGTVVASNPGQTGYIIYTRAGFMMVQMMQPNRKAYAAAQPTAAEAGDAIRSYTNYFGPFYTHEADGYVVHDQVGTLNVGRIGPSPQQRFYQFTGKRLLLKPPPTFSPDGPTVQGTITWEQADIVSGTR
jgi:hypothetical protein